MTAKTALRKTQVRAIIQKISWLKKSVAAGDYPKALACCYAIDVLAHRDNAFYRSVDRGVLFDYRAMDWAEVINRANHIYRQERECVA